MPNTARDFIGYGRDYPEIVWPGRARIAISLVINFEEGSERTPLYGDPVAESRGEAPAVPSGERNLLSESLFDYGGRAGFWRLFDILERHGVPCTVFACGMALERNPRAAREITVRGHEVASHGYRWMARDYASLDEERDEIRRAVDAIERMTGDRPLGWFSISLSENTRELLVEEGGFLYDCDSFADDLPYFVDVAGTKWLVIPYDLITNDGFYARPPGYSEPMDFFLQLKESFDCLYREGATHPKMMSVGLHMRTTGYPARSWALEEFIRYAGGFPHVWFARRIDIARWWLDRYSYLPALTKSS